jgi:hypothetical protein
MVKQIAAASVRKMHGLINASCRRSSWRAFLFSIEPPLAGREVLYLKKRTPQRLGHRGGSGDLIVEDAEQHGWARE